MNAETKWTKGQWPDNIVSGNIRYGRASNYDGFYLADASHGIPTFGSVSAESPAPIRGQFVRVFNYPDQTEQIAAELVKRWNSYVSLIEERKEMVKALQHIQRTAKDKSEKAWWRIDMIADDIDALLSRIGEERT